EDDDEGQAEDADELLPIGPCTDQCLVGVRRQQRAEPRCELLETGQLPTSLPANSLRCLQRRTVVGKQPRWGVRVPVSGVGLHRTASSGPFRIAARGRPFRLAAETPRRWDSVRREHMPRISRLAPEDEMPLSRRAFLAAQGAAAGAVLVPGRLLAALEAATP